jgi:hypothetical protein
MSATAYAPGSSFGRRAAAASEAHVAHAARAVLERGTAVDAVIAGILAAAAECPTVFWGPVQLLAGGGGAGLIAIDGRVRQPGRGVPRPRGFLADEPVPEAARVGISALPAALAAAAASLGTLALLTVAGPAIALAKARSLERAAVLEAFARRGAQVLTENAIASELVATAGRASRGLLTQADLAEVRPDVARFDDRSLEPSGILTVPWRGPGEHDASFTHVVAAGDARGMVAAACYEAPLEGLAVPTLGMILPHSAAPVMRGQSRVIPGEPLVAAAPIALRARRGVVDIAIGVAAVADAERSLQRIADVLDQVTALAEALAGLRGGRAVAVARTPDSARVIASA